MKITAIIQARANSKRLPGKVLKDIFGKPSLQRMIERVKLSNTIDELIVATSNCKNNREIIKICKLLKINYFIGSEFNVLERFYKASKKFNAKHIVRLTADCPMHDPQIIDHVIKIYKNNDYDYVSNVLKRTYPDGLDVEVFNFESLEVAFQNANEDLDKEHVTTYLRNKISLIKNRKYKKYNVENQKDLSSLRWTLDNQDDLNKIKIFFKYLPENFSWKEAIKFESEKKFKFENEQL